MKSIGVDASNNRFIGIWLISCNTASDIGESPSGKATDSDSVIREWRVLPKIYNFLSSKTLFRRSAPYKSLHPSQEGIIRTMKEIHGSYYFLRKNISALSFAESRDFKGILRETDSLTFGDISITYANKRSQTYITLKRYMKNLEDVEYWKIITFIKTLQ